MALFGLANLVCAAYREKSDKNAEQVEFWECGARLLFEPFHGA
jgi:hypothetical protein